MGCWTILSASSSGIERKDSPAGLMTTAAPSSYAWCSQSISWCSALLWAKNMSNPSSAPFSRQRFSTSASVTLPYRWGSRLPSMFRFGPFRTYTAVVIAALSPGGWGTFSGADAFTWADSRQGFPAAPAHRTRQYSGLVGQRSPLPQVVEVRLVGFAHERRGDRCDHCGSTGEDRYRHPGLQAIACERGSDRGGETTERETELGSDRHPGHAHLGRELLVVHRERRSRVTGVANHHHQNAGDEQQGDVL